MTFTVSPSQVENAYLCLRKWGLTTIAKAPRKQDIGAFRGESVHKILEWYGRGRVPPEAWTASLVADLNRRYAADLAEKQISAEDYAGRIIAVANKMIPLLPDEPIWPGKTEHAFKFELDGVTWAGKIDYWHGNLVRDHKVCSSFDFARTDCDELDEDGNNKNLRHNLQALVYAYAVETETVRLQWGYGQPGKTPRARNVEVEVNRADVVRELAPHNEAARELVRLRVLNPDPMTLEPTWSACEKMGGCPFQDRCKPTAQQLIDTVFPTETTNKEHPAMGLVSKAKQAAGNSTTTTKTEVAPKPAQGARTDDGHAKHEAEAMCAQMKALTLPDDAIVAALAAKFLGLDKAWLSALVAGKVDMLKKGPDAEPKSVASEISDIKKELGNGSAVNPSDSPKEDAKLDTTDEPAKKGRGSRAGKTPASNEIPEMFAKAIEAILRDIDENQTEATAARCEARARAALACAEAIKCLRST